jgi:hypothetical protein
LSGSALRADLALLALADLIAVVARRADGPAV